MRVSVIIPAYQAECFVARAIVSALRQSERSLEVLVVDDASTDGTASVVTEWARQDRRLSLLRNERNAGPAAARNRGLAQAKGDWIALLDADDEFEPRRLETLIAQGEQKAADLVSDNLLLCQENQASTGSPMIPGGMFPTARWMSAADFVLGNIGSAKNPRVSLGFMQPAIRRRFIEAHQLRYDEQNRFAEDFMFSLSSLLAGGCWWVTPEAMYRYHVRRGSLTERQSAADLQRVRAFEAKLLQTHPKVAVDAALARALHRHKSIIERHYYYRAFTDAAKARAFARAFEILFESARGFHHIIHESLVQAPTIATKALRGGYWRPLPGMVKEDARLIAQPGASRRIEKEG